MVYFAPEWWYTFTGIFTKGFIQNKKVAKQGGAVAGNAIKELESRTGKKVVSNENFLPEKKSIKPKKGK